MRKNERSSIFLIEIIVAILFFSMVSAICLRAFVLSHTISAESDELNHAVVIATTQAELIKVGEVGGEIKYDGEWKETDSSEYEYSANVTDDGKDEAGVHSYEVSVSDKNGEIYSLNVEVYDGKEE